MNKKVILILFLITIELSLVLASQCNDGIDNDGDGLVDWQYDLGCYGPNDNTEYGNGTTYGIGVVDHGWTVFEPTNTTRIIYVSSSTGDDTNDGLTPQTAVKTLNQGYDLLCERTSINNPACRRDNQADWLLLKRGDTWIGEHVGPASGWWMRNGESAKDPLVIATYGDSKQRPQIIDGAWRNTQTTGTLNYLAITGIEFYSRIHDPTATEYQTGLGCQTAINRMKPGTTFLLEDLQLRYTGMVIQLTNPSELTETTLRRLVITDSYSETSGHCQGAYMKDLANVLIEEVIADANGWYAPDGEAGIGPRSWFNHDFYFKEFHNFTVKNSIISRPSGHGLKTSSDTAYGFTNIIYDNNFFYGGDDGIGLDHSSATDNYTHLNATITNNVFTQQGVLYPKNGNATRGKGIHIAQINGGIITNNLFIHKDYPTEKNVLTIGEKEVILNDISFVNNTIYDWRWVKDTPSLLIKKNAQAQFTNFIETPNTVNPDPATLPEPNRSIETYATALGINPDYESFITEARKQSKYNWQDVYTAEAINDYLREGVGMKKLNTIPIIPPTNTINITLEGFDGTTTNFKQLRTLTNITGIILEKLRYGKIRFLKELTLRNHLRLNNYIRIEQNLIEINTTTLPELNTSIELTIKGTYNQPLIYKDGQPCPETECQLINASNNEVLFTITTI